MPRPTRVAAAVLPLVAALAGCAPPPAAPSVPSVLATGQPSAEQQAAFVTAVAGIAPPLAQAPDRLVLGGREVCLDIADDLDAPSLAARAAERFSGDSYTVTPEQAGRIVAAARTTLCPH